MARKLNTFFALFALVAVIALPAAHAIPKVGDKFGDWVFECETVKANNTICALSQTLIQKENNQRVLKLLLSKQGSKGELILVAVTPLGIYIPAGVSGTIDKGAAFPMLLQACNKQGCIASIRVESDLKKALQNGHNLAIRFAVRPNTKPLIVNASLKDIADGIKAIDIR